MKKFLIILSVVVLVGGIIYLGYYFSTKNSIAPGAPAQTAGGLPEIPAGTGGSPSGTGVTTGASPSGTGSQGQLGGGLSILAQGDYSSFAVASDTSIVAVDHAGKIYRIVPGSNPSPLSDSALDNFTSASFSFDGQKVVISFGAAENKQFSVFDITTRSWTPLQSGILSASWKPGSYTLGYVAAKGAVKTISSLDLSKPKSVPVAVTSLHIEDPIISWSAPDKIAISQKTSGLYKNLILVFDLKKKTYTSPASDVPGLVGKWDSAANRVLAFFGDPLAKGGDLRLLTLSGSLINKFQFLTLPEKCFFASDAAHATTTIATSTKTKAVIPPPPPENLLYCAVPRDPGTLNRSTLPDDYYTHAIFTSDNIYKVDLDSGIATSLFDDQNQNVDIATPFINSGKYIFINRLNGNIYSLQLLK